ncbi:type II toxin-antitoxin system VapC family toxin [Roseofilum sp. Guam]|uniref:type II toxin-antitoxin system VapC family toxin n=1 Tax=Roseofilum sp. Guam TaxID=2821502 RepID=UPI00298E764E|nr:PIN domain-containing protein [Roseofilum sp. Guam]
MDTNLLLRSIQVTHPMHPEASRALGTLLQGDDRVCLCSQNFIEFWNVCTRPIAKNGLGMSVEQADAELTRLEGIFSVLPDLPTIYPQWRQLVKRYQVRGANVHDARLVAVMLASNLTYILTYNTADFRRFSEITVVHPSEVIP